MGNSVYAETMGLFHQASGGKGVAAGDVCLSPPPPPAGPVPVPYVNLANASDLTKGSSTVKIQGTPTALENASEVALSSGDEGGVQGGGVVTHKFKGKATFVLWSFTVKVEGKGVCRNGDQMQQNEASEPGNIICAAAFVDIHPLLDALMKLKAALGDCPEEKKDPPHTKTTQDQRDGASKAGETGGGCWSCDKSVNAGEFKNGKSYNRGQRWVADHQPPQSVVWRLLGGCHDEKAFNKWKADEKAVIPQCTGCSNAQGSYLSQNDGSAVLEAMGIPF